MKEEAVSEKHSQRSDDDVISVDTYTGGISEVTAGYLLPAHRPVLIECGPALSIERVIRELTKIGLEGSDLAYLVVTHIHLDHAGGAGDIAKAFPSATIVASELGAPHLSNPERLNASSRRVFGQVMDEIYGDCTPVDEVRILGVEDGHVIHLGGGRHLELMYTPGHAKHHISVWDNETGAIFSGDSVGVKLAGMRELRPATSPPDFHLEAATRSLRRYIQRAPSRVYLAHYGPIDPPVESLENAIERLHMWAETAEVAYRERDELDHVAETLGRRFSDTVELSGIADPDSALWLPANVNPNAAGLLHYFRRRDSGTLTDVG